MLDPLGLPCGQEGDMLDMFLNTMAGGESGAGELVPPNGSDRADSGGGGSARATGVGAVGGRKKHWSRDLFINWDAHAGDQDQRVQCAACGAGPLGSRSAPADPRTLMGHIRSCKEVRRSHRTHPTQPPPIIFFFEIATLRFGAQHPTLLHPLPTNPLRTCTRTRPLSYAAIRR